VNIDYLTPVPNTIIQQLGKLIIPQRYLTRHSTRRNQTQLSAVLNTNYFVFVPILHIPDKVGLFVGIGVAVIIKNKV